MLEELLVVNSNMHNQLPTSRLINEKVTYAGLSQEDLLTIVISFFFPFSILGLFDLGLVAIPISILIGGILITVRLKYRRRKIRDYLRFQYIRFLKNGVIYDPSNRRYN